MYPFSLNYDLIHELSAHCCVKFLKASTIYGVCPLSAHFNFTEFSKRSELKDGFARRGIAEQISILSCCIQDTLSSRAALGLPAA